MKHWNHRLIEHRNSAMPEEEIYTTVHEVFYADDGGCMYWAQSPCSPRSEEVAQWILNAFSKPIVAWVDDDSLEDDEYGIECYKSWGWMPGIKVTPDDDDDDDFNEGMEDAETGND